VRLLTLYTKYREDSLQVLGNLLRDKSTIAQINNNLSDNFAYDNQMLEKPWQDFLIQIGFTDQSLARQLAN
jgi:hypothetical protein